MTFFLLARYAANQTGEAEMWMNRGGESSSHQPKPNQTKLRITLQPNIVASFSQEKFPRCQIAASSLGTQHGIRRDSLDAVHLLYPSVKLNQNCDSQTGTCALIISTI